MGLFVCHFCVVFAEGPLYGLGVNKILVISTRGLKINLNFERQRSVTEVLYNSSLPISQLYIA